MNSAARDTLKMEGEFTAQAIGYGGKRVVNEAFRQKDSSSLSCPVDFGEFFEQVRGNRRHIALVIMSLRSNPVPLSVTPRSRTLLMWLTPSIDLRVTDWPCISNAMTKSPA